MDESTNEDKHYPIDIEDIKIEEHSLGIIIKAEDEFEEPGTSFENDTYVSVDGEVLYPAPLEPFDSEYLNLEPLTVKTPRRYPFRCDYCKYIFKRATLTHYETKHKVVLCKYCKLIFANMKSLKQHINLEHKYECSKCNEEVYGRNSCCLKYHMHLKHNEKISKRTVRKSIYCMFCNEEFRNYLKLRHHMNVVHGKFICFVCGMYFESEHQLVEHKNIENHDYRCKICYKEFISLMSYKCHMTNIHNMVLIESKSDDKYVCEVCKEDYMYLHHLKRHLKRSHGKFYCSLCTKIFDSAEEINTHSLSVHNQPTVWVHKCEYCGQHYDSVQSLAKHVKEIHTRRPMSCEQCGETFKNEANLDHHQQYIHNGMHQNKDSTCHFCGIQLQKKYMTYHIKRHLNLRDVCCSKCPLKFFDKLMLSNHMSTIHKVGLITCHLCKVHVKINVYQEHMKTYHNKARNMCKVKCPYCNISLAQHMLKIHVDAYHRYNVALKHVQINSGR